MTALELVVQAKVIPVLRGSDPETVVELARVLYEEGFQTLEITFTVPGVLDVIRELCRLENAVVGAGTVLDAGQLEAALQAGARFLVSPGLEPKLLEVARHCTIPFLPGVFTASEVMQARAQGFRVLKLFPGELGGVKHLKSLRGPFPDLYFMPTGGVSAENLHEWFAAGAVAVGMGGYLVSESVRATREKTKAVQAALMWLSMPEGR
ncbi:bifunctional 4-hydroxy-2-oxoglutarate aldolase/2-dehydro-3-deoxy-phosphogluconate aldolase [Meiothermus sp.]|uniref:bifunctional 4-hydroxy-2-oxoglutarate aldolase/2-dehydro-3-deoxy-phosphogluconate aldolase n=1 Tax=Meiothermus sp. TaxID=1955249 RepID=UPI00307FA823